MICNFVVAIQELAKGNKRITYTYNDIKMSLTYDPEEEQFYDKDGNKVFNVIFPVDGRYHIHSALLTEKEESYLKGFIKGLDPNDGVSYAETTILPLGNKLKLTLDGIWEYDIDYCDIGSSCEKLECGKIYKLKDLLI